jgi:integrase
VTRSHRRSRTVVAEATPILGRVTVEEHLTEWLAAVSMTSARGRPLAPTTAEKYARAVRRINAKLGDKRLLRLTAADVRRLRASILEQTKDPTTVSDTLRILGQALGAAVADGRLDRNVADARIVARPSAIPKPFTLIGPEMAGKILTAARGTDLDAPVHLALGAGLRREEVLGLRWSSVDLDAATLKVESTITWASGELHVGPPKTEAGKRTVGLPAVVVDALKRTRVAQDRRRLLCGAAWQDGDLVVDAGDGGPVKPPSFSTAWRRWAKEHGFAGTTFHGLRHGYATLMLTSGVPDAVALGVMGHTSTAMLQRYREVVPELLKDAALRMGSVLGQGGGRDS